MNEVIQQFKLRRNEEQVTPDYEDFGLFKGPVTKLQADVTLKVTSNGRADTLAQGFTEGEKPVTLVFAGRRRLLFGPLNSRLRGLKRKHEVQLRKERGDDFIEDYPLTDIRLPIVVEGCWRPRFELDADGFQSRIYYFLVARWMFHAEGGKQKVFGTLPVAARAAQ